MSVEPTIVEVDQVWEIQIYSGKLGLYRVARIEDRPSLGPVVVLDPEPGPSGQAEATVAALAEHGRLLYEADGTPVPAVPELVRMDHDTRTCEHAGERKYRLGCAECERAYEEDAPLGSELVSPPFRTGLPTPHTPPQPRSPRDPANE